MPRKTSKHGVDLYTILRAGGYEISSANPRDANVEQFVEVGWNFARRPGTIRVTAKVIQNPQIATHAGGNPFFFSFQSVRKLRRHETEQMTLHGPEGQTIIDSGLVEVQDVFTGHWDPDDVGIQLRLDVQR